MKIKLRLNFLLFSVLITAFLFSFVLPTSAAPGINKQINFQGKLVNSNGTNVADNTYSVVFTLYDAAGGGTTLWDETQNVTTSNGIFQVALGSVDTTLGNVNFNQDNLYLGIKVGADSEMTPRVRFSTVPYALNAEKVSGLTVTNTTGTFTLANAKTLAVNNSLTFSGTDGTTLTFQGTDTYVGRATTDTLTNKTVGSTGLTFLGATTDIITGTNEDLTFAPNGTGDSIFTQGNASQFTINATPTGDTAQDSIRFNLNPTITGSTATLQGLLISQTDNANTGVYDSLFKIQNLKTPETTTNGFVIEQNAAGSILTNAITLLQTAGTITNAINANGVGISLTELQALDGKDGTLVDQNDFIAGDGAGATSTGSGLEVGTGGIGLLQGCSNGQILKWTEGSSVWGCAADSTSGTSQFIVKGTDENVPSGTTLQNDADLTFAVGAGETWIVDFVLRVTNLNSATPDWKAALLGASGWTCSITMSGLEPAGAAFPQVNGTDCDNAPTALVNNTIVADANVPFQVNIRGRVTTNSAGSITLQWAPNTSGSLTVMAGSYVIAQRVGGSDLAEVYYTKDISIGPGDVVSLDSEIAAGVKKATKAYDSQTLGIISTKPGLILGDGETNTEDIPVMVALSGRVPVKVSTENGAIHPGDFLTSSSIPGVAMRATKAGSVIGQAMTSFDGEGLGIVTAFIKTGTANGTIGDEGRMVLTKFLSWSETENPVDSEIMTDRLAAGIEIITPRLIADEVIARLIKVEQIEGLDLLVKSLLTEQTVMGTASANPAIEEDSLMTEETVASASTNLTTDLVLENLSVAGLATVSANLRVKNNTLIEGILTVIDTLMSKQLIVNGLATFFGDAVFKGSVSFASHPIFSNDTAGIAIIKKGETQVAINFANEYKTVPIVTAGISFEEKPTEEARQRELEQSVLGSDLSFIVTKRSTKGFTILLNKPAVDDITFSWTALSVLDDSLVENYPILSPSPAGDIMPLEQAREEVNEHAESDQ